MGDPAERDRRTRRGHRRGTLLAPYTLLYSASVLLIVVVPALAVSPIATRVLALIANPAMFVAFAAWLLGGLAAMVAAARRRASLTNTA